MGLAYYPTFEKELEGFDAGSVDGKAIAANMEALCKIAKELRVPPPDSFCSTSAEEFEDLIGDEVPGDASPAEWFDPREGLSTFEPLLEELRRNSRPFTRSEGLLEDIQNTVAMLKAATAQSVRFRLTMDF